MHASLSVRVWLPASPLRATDDLADLGHQYVHGRDRGVVVVQAHVERLDAFGVARHDRRALENLMLGMFFLLICRRFKRNSRPREK